MVRVGATSTQWAPPAWLAMLLVKLLSMMSPEQDSCSIQMHTVVRKQSERDKHTQDTSSLGSSASLALLHVKNRLCCEK